MIISTVMSPRKKNFDEEPIEPEVLDPSEEVMPRLVRLPK